MSHTFPPPPFMASMMATGAMPPPTYNHHHHPLPHVLPGMPVRYTSATPTLQDTPIKNTVPPYATLPYDDIIRMYGVDLIRTGAFLLNTTPTINYRAANLFQRYCSATLPELEEKLWRRHNKDGGVKESSSSKEVAHRHSDRVKALQTNNDRPSVPHTTSSEQWSIALFLRRDQFKAGSDEFDSELHIQASHLFGPPAPYTFTPWSDAAWIRFPLDIIRFGCPAFPTTRRPRLSISKDAPVTKWINEECHKTTHDPSINMEDDPRYLDQAGIPVFPAITLAPSRIDGSFIALVGACLLLAAKLEDPPTSRIRSIVNVMERLDRRRRGFQGEIAAASPDILEALKANIVAAESHILTTLAYETAADPPHKYAVIILSALLEMDDSTKASPDRTSQFLNATDLTVGYCNDSALSSTLSTFVGADGLADGYEPSDHDSADELWDLSPTRVSPQAVACAAVHLALMDVFNNKTQSSTFNADSTDGFSSSYLPKDWSVAFDVHPALLNKCVDELKRVAASAPRMSLVPSSQGMELTDPKCATPLQLVGPTPTANTIGQQQPSSAGNCACPLGAANFMRLYVCEMECIERPLEAEYYRRQRERGVPTYPTATLQGVDNGNHDDDVSRMMGLFGSSATTTPKVAAPDDLLLKRKARSSKKAAASDSDDDSFFSSSVSSYSSSSSESPPRPPVDEKKPVAVTTEIDKTVHPSEDKSRKDASRRGHDAREDRHRDHRHRDSNRRDRRDSDSRRHQDDKRSRDDDRSRRHDREVSRDKRPRHEDRDRKEHRRSDRDHDRGRSDRNDEDRRHHRSDKRDDEHRRHRTGKRDDEHRRDRDRHQHKSDNRKSDDKKRH